MKRRDFLKAGLGTAAAVAAGAKFDPLNAAESNMQPPNILLLFSDQHNAGVMGCAGHPDVITPELDKLAASGVIFSRAYCQDAICAPSRASIMTGQYCRTLGILDNPDRINDPDRFVTLASCLRSNGYRTAAFGKRHLEKGVDNGFDIACSHLDNESSIQHYREWVRDRGQLDEFIYDWNAEFGYSLPGNQSAPMACRISKLKPENTMEAFTAEKTIEFIRSAKKSHQPFFCWSSFYRPHQPYTPLREYAAMYYRDRIELPESLNEPIENLPPGMQAWRRNENKPWCLAKAAREPELYRRYIAAYYALVTEIDYHIGAIMRTLEEEGLADNTIVVYTADHGDFVGAHGMIEKDATAHNIYEDTLRVPLIIRYPKHVRSGKKSSDLVELIDLYPTLLDFAGISSPADYVLPGRSLKMQLAEGKSLGREFAISENKSQVTVIGPRYKLGTWIKSQSGNYPDMLFDRKTDPLEIHNIIGKDESSSVEKELREQMRSWMAVAPNAGKSDR